MDARALAAYLEQFRRRGAKAAELLEAETTGQRVKVERGKLAAVEPLRHQACVARVWLEGGRLGIARGKPEEREALLSAASSRAESAPPDPHAGPVVRQRGTLGGLGIDDRRFPSIAASDREEVLLTAERSARQVDRRVVPGPMVYDERRTVRRYASTRGVALEEWDTLYEIRGSASADASPERVQRSDTIGSRTFASIASLPFGTSLGRRVADLLRQNEPVDGAVRVLLTPSAVAAIFARLATGFSRPTTGPPSKRFFALSLDDRPSLDPRIHLLDDGTASGGLRTRSFDDRGALPIPLVLIREGQVEGAFLDPERAHAVGSSPTGHVTGDGQQPSNLALRAGGRSVNATLTDLGGTVLQIDDIDPGGIDLATGMLDVVIDGVMLRQNKPYASVRRARLSGDLAVVLATLVEVCTDTDRVGHVDAPAMVVDGFTVTSARSARASKRAPAKAPAKRKGKAVTGR